MDRTTLPVAVIGGGPVGLAAAAHLLAKGLEPVVFEAGPAVGSSILEWGQVRLFSPWRYVVDTASEKLLAAHGWQRPDGESFPTGRELVDRYLAPLAALPEMAPRIRLGARVTGISRLGFDRMKTEGRESSPFVVRVVTAGGTEEVLARAIVDASGTWTKPNPLGASGLPALGESALASRIFYGIPDVLGAHKSRYAGKRVLVVGSGHSAFNALLDLVALSKAEPSTRIVWVIRRPSLANLLGGGANDQLPERGRLGQRVRGAVAAGRLQLVIGFSLVALEETPDGIVATSAARTLPPVDEIIGATGFRPDLSLESELRLGLDAIVESPSALAPLIDPNLHSCGSVPPHGAEELKHPEPDFYIAGMKSYGRAPTFLMLTGYEQVRSIALAIKGDWDAARRVELVLPETGVCSTDSAPGGACCPAPSECEPAAVSCGVALPALGRG